MKIVVTGSAGMIGSHVVKELIAKGHTVIGLDRRKLEDSRFKIQDSSKIQDSCFKQYVVDLLDSESISKIFDEENPDKVIHLAALAHTAGEKDLSFERYKRINVDATYNIAAIAQSCHCELLFISTVDAVGMVKGKISGDVKLNPVSNYGKSKAMAEDEVKKVCSKWNIYRFSPVYTADIKRDIEKRYYLKYPNLAYKIGKGEKFEVLDVTRAVAAMVSWVSGFKIQDSSKPEDSGKLVPVEPNTIHIIKDPELLDINDLIKAEKAEGRAKFVLWIPRWMVWCGYYVLYAIFGKCNKTYLVFKALWPFRSE